MTRSLITIMWMRFRLWCARRLFRVADRIVGDVEAATKSLPLRFETLRLKQ
jgi:hypothetical protein